MTPVIKALTMKQEKVLELSKSSKYVIIDYIKSIFPIKLQTPEHRGPVRCYWKVKSSEKLI